MKFIFHELETKSSLMMKIVFLRSPFAQWKRQVLRKVLYKCNEFSEHSGYALIQPTSIFSKKSWRNFEEILRNFEIFKNFQNFFRNF